MTERQCHAPGCMEEFDIQIGSERRCFTHALEKANEIRAQKGKPPLTVGDDTDGELHVRQ